MSALCAPRIAGVAGGVGTTTLATALRAYDRGREGRRGVDVLACRTTGQSLHQAATIVAWLAENGRPRPVLAVTSEQPGRLPGPCNARLRMMEPQLAAAVVLPYVGHWRELSDPLAEAATLSEQPADELPKPLRPYGRALASLAELVLRSGLLTDPRHTPGAPAQACGDPRPTRSTGGMRAVVNDPATTSGEFLSVPLARFAAYGGAR